MEEITDSAERWMFLLVSVMGTMNILKNIIELSVGFI